MFYRIKENQLYDWADYQYSDDCLETDIITQTELDIHPNKVIIQDGILALNHNYEQEEEEKEKQRVGKLSCTKRVLVLMLEQIGFDYYEQILHLIESNRQAKLEWELCERLERNNPLIDVVGEQLGISPEQIDNMFKYANGEITSLIDSEV